MSLTSTVAKLPIVSDNNVDTYVIDKTDLVLVASDQSDDGSIKTAEYILADGDPLTEVSVIIRIQIDQNSKNGKERMLRLSWKFVTWELVADSVSGRTEKIGPIEAGEFLTLPLRSTVSVADRMKLMSVAHTLAHGAVTSGVPADTYMSALTFKFPTIFG